MDFIHTLLFIIYFYLQCIFQNKLQASSIYPNLTDKFKKYRGRVYFLTIYNIYLKIYNLDTGQFLSDKCRMDVDEG